MEVRRFRWWADEAAAVEEEESEVERRMASMRRKRSVAELFAAVPRVAGGQAKRTNNGMQAKKGKLVLAVEVKARKGFKKKKVPNGIAFSKKEKNGSIKATSMSMFQDSIRKRKMTKCLGKKKRDQETSILLDKNSKKGKKNSFLDSRKNAIKNSFQAQSILHKQSKVGFSTLTNNTDVTCKLNSSCKPKHVTFSLDIFGWTAPLAENNEEQAQLVQIFQRPSQEGHDQRSGDELQLVFQQVDAIPEAIEEDTSSLSEIVVSTGVFCTFPVAKPKAVRNSVDRNHCTETSTSSNYLNSISLACLSCKMPSENFEGVSCHLDNDEVFSLDAECLGEGNHVIPQGSSNPVSLSVKAVSGDIYRSLLSQPSSYCLDDRRRSTLLERMVDNLNLGKVHDKFVSSGKDLMNSISSSPGSKKPSDAQGTDCVPVYRNKYFGDDYAGLPLNSRGEFVKLHPGGTLSSVNISKRQCLGESSSRPSSFPAFYTPITCTDHVNLRPSHRTTPNIHSIDQSPHFTPTAPTEYVMDFRQLPCSERMEIHEGAIPRNKCPCTNQQELSAVCFSPESMECHNPHQKLLGMQSCFMRQDCEQNTRSTSETTTRLRGKTVTFGTSSIQCRDLNKESPGSCRQTQVEDRSFQGKCRKAFPQLFHWAMADPPAFRIPRGERELSENPSFLPAAELMSELDTNSFRTNSYSQQPELTAANNLYVQPATWCNKGELRHQQPVMPNQVQSSAEDMLLVSMHLRNTQNVASVPCFNRKNSVRNFTEKRPAPYQPGYFSQKFSNMTQRNPMSSSMSGYDAVQSTPGSTTQTKFTFLPPLPPSLAPSHVSSLDYAQHRGFNTITFRPWIPAVYQTSKPSAPGDAIPRDERLKWASGHMNGNGKRPAEKGDAFLTSSKKLCTALQDLNLLPMPERRLQFGGSRPDAQPVGFGPGHQSDRRLGSLDAHSTWSYPVSTVGPVKLKSGVRHKIQPSASSMGKGISWAVDSVPPFAVENAACAASTSKNQDTEIYKF